MIALLFTLVGPPTIVRAATPYFANVTTDGYSVAVTDCATPSNVDCTLREAIQAANGNAGADTVTLKNGATYQLSINPVAGGDNTTGDLNIIESVAIVVAGGGTATIDASTIPAHDRVLMISSGTVSITGVTLLSGQTSANSGGGANSSNGGGILNVGGSINAE